MDAMEDEIIGYLSGKYVGPVATRALWGWAGGKEDEVVYFESSIEQWRALWKKARGGASVSPLALLREALLDDPGNSFLINSIEGLGGDIFPEGRTAAEMLMVLTEEIKPDFNQNRLTLSLEKFPECEKEHAFAALTPFVGSYIIGETIKKEKSEEETDEN